MNAASSARVPLGKFIEAENKRRKVLDKLLETLPLPAFNGLEI